MSKWQLYEAKNKLSQIIDTAMQGEVQYITRKGVEAVVVISIDEYKKLKKPKKSFTEILLGGEKVEDFTVERAKSPGRSIEL
jgi:antitoxin Phd